MLEWIINKIDYYWGLFLQLDPAMAISLFLIYGVAFEFLYARSLYAFRDFKRWEASIITVVLFLLSLWGLSEAIKENITYAIPISFGTFVGTFVQVTLERRKHRSETGRKASGGKKEGL